MNVWCRLRGHRPHAIWTNWKAGTVELFDLAPRRKLRLMVVAPHNDLHVFCRRCQTTLLDSQDQRHQDHYVKRVSVPKTDEHLESETQVPDSEVPTSLPRLSQASLLDELQLEFEWPST